MTNTHPTTHGKNRRQTADGQSKHASEGKSKGIGATRGKGEPKGSQGSMEKRVWLGSVWLACAYGLHSLHGLVGLVGLVGL